MFHDPVEEGFLEANVVTDFLALYPLVAEDFFAFSEEFLVEERLLHEIVLFVSREAHGDGWSVGPSRRVVNDLVTNTARGNCSFKSRTWPSRQGATCLTTDRD
jgi:hypothetical protein